MMERCSGSSMCARRRSISVTISTKFVDVEAPARRAGDDRHAALAQLKRLQNLPRDAHLLLRLGGERDADGVADAFVQEYAEAD